MDTTSTELFGHLIYDENLTYDELLDAEEYIIRDLEILFDRAGAEHVDFFPLGDALTFQCEFATYKRYIFRKIACDIVQILPAGISGRIFCLSHSLEISTLYWVRPKEWQEANITIPDNPPEGLKVWRSKDLPKETNSES